MFHTHGPGQPPHSHSHSPVSGPTQGSPMQQQYVAPPLPDPKMQALIEADYKPVNMKLGPPNSAQALCAPHSREKCDECGVDFSSTNFLAKLFVQNPNLVVPPPPQVIQHQRTQAVMKTKDDGNALFKANKLKEAVGMYNMAVNVAVQRLPWEPNNLMKEELSMVLSNRSAAYAALGDHVSALVDSELVIQLKRPWSKGYFRKAKALVELTRYEEAREAIKLGLAFEPNNTELKNFLDEIESRITRKKKSVT